MELKFNNGKVTIIDTTIGELDEFMIFVKNANVNKVENKTENKINDVAPSVKVVAKADVVKSVTDKDSEDDVMTIPDIAKKLGMLHQTLNSRISRYNIPVYKVNDKGWRYYKYDDIVNHFNEHPLSAQARRGVAKKTSKVSTKVSAKVSEPKSSFSKWQAAQRDVVVAKGLDVGKTFSEVYKEMTKVYGISWDQLRKEYYNEKKCPCHSTIQLVYFLQYEQEHNAGVNYKNLFENLLADRVA